MSDSRCKQAYDKHVEAMNEWVAASYAVQTFAATTPLDPTEDVRPISFEEYSEASKKEAEAHEKYFRALEEYFACLKSVGLLRGK